MIGFFILTFVAFFTGLYILCAFVWWVEGGASQFRIKPAVFVLIVIAFALVITYHLGI